jgi:hypothetical protein
MLGQKINFGKLGKAFEEGLGGRHTIGMAKHDRFGSPIVKGSHE